MKFDLGSRNKIIIKIGSSLLVEEGNVKKKWLKTLAQDVAQMNKEGCEIILVSSGSIALGKTKLRTKNKKLSLPEKQAAAAVGQIQLMRFYHDFFEECGLNVAQILLTVSDCDNRVRYLNSQNTIGALLKNNIIPIVNENDTIAVDEIKIGDNDRLAARVAQMVGADLLILFSDIDGLYDKNPRKNHDAKLIHEVYKIDKTIENMASDTVSNVGTGGMITKIKAAKMASISSCDTIITDGQPHHPFTSLLSGKQNYTIFHGNKTDSKSKKKWLSGFFNAQGELVVNNCAKEALMSKNISLLPIGVTKISGKFSKGSAVYINDEKGNHIASGITNYSSDDAKLIIGKNSKETKELFGPNAKIELVHIDDMVVLK